MNHPHLSTSSATARHRPFLPDDYSHPTVLPPLLMLPSSPPFAQQVTSHHSPSFLNEWTDEWMIKHRRSTSSNNNVLISIKPLFMSSNQHFGEEVEIIILFPFLDFKNCGQGSGMMHLGLYNLVWGQTEPIFWFGIPVPCLMFFALRMFFSSHHHTNTHTHIHADTRTHTPIQVKS